jgi:hypothetical protein
MRHAEDPILIGRELILQGCDWSNQNLLSIPVKQPKVFQVLLSFPSSIASRVVSRSNRVCEEVLRAARHHNGFFPFEIFEEKRKRKQGKSENFISKIS